MGKAERLKNLKNERQKIEFKIELLPDGNVTISGPVDMNPIGVLDIFSKAMNGIVRHHSEKAAKNQTRILKPNGIKIPGLH